MAKSVEIKLNIGELAKLRKSEEVQAVLAEHGYRALNSLGKGYEGEQGIGKTRANFGIRAIWHQTAKDNAENNTILKAVGASK